MKKLNSKGFTLIELLAVITIMGILMLVAIPAVSRTIENSRRDTFADISKEYVNAVRNAVLADNITCGTGTNAMVASATPDGEYYFPIDTTQQNTKDLMEAGGKSPFGSSEMKGYVRWKKSTAANTGKTTTVYFISLSDTGKHGLSTDTSNKKPNELSEIEIKRANVITNLSNVAATDPTAPSGVTITKCQLS